VYPIINLLRASFWAFVGKTKPTGAGEGAVQSLPKELPDSHLENDGLTTSTQHPKR
jgi:hypothetical protein